MANNEQALTTVANSELVPWSEEEVRLVSETVAKDQNLSAQELTLFARVCQLTGLNPFKREIYAVRYEGQNKPVTFQTGIDGFRKIAKRSGKFRGYTETEWCGDDGIWKDVWLGQDAPSAARVGVLHDDYDHPVYGIAKFSEYVAMKWVDSNDRSKGKEPNAQWEKRPAHMLAKCAEALAIRRAFPDDLGGLYTNDEMEGERVDRSTGEVIDGEATTVEGTALETFGVEGLTLDVLVDQVRQVIRKWDFNWSVLRSALPGWDGSTVKEGLAAWARERPNEDVIAAIDAYVAEQAQAREEEAAGEAENEALGSEAEQAAEAEQVGMFDQ